MVNKLTNTVKPLDEVDKINEIIDALDDVSVAVDNSTITKNASDQLQTVAVKDNRSGNAIKTWTGTKAQYDAIATKDANTLYFCADSGEIYLGSVLISNKTNGKDIGDVIFSLTPKIDAGLHLLDGALIQGDGIYSAFVDYIAGLYTDNPSASYFAQGSNIETWTQPTLTSNGTLGGDSFAVYSSRQYTANYYAYKAFDGNSTTNWLINTANVPTKVDLDFYNPNPINVTNIEITNRSGYDTYATKADVYGSFDNVNFTLLASVENSTATTALAKWNIDLSSNNKYYTYYRIQFSDIILDSSAANRFGLNEVSITAKYFTVTPEQNWQSSVTNYGVCGKFVYDYVNNTVRLPKITGIIEGTTDITALGDLVEAGLPIHTHTRGTMNITGGCFIEAVHSGFYGALYDNGGSSTYMGNNQHTASGNICFDASRSWTGSTSEPNYTNANIQNSNTVQPQTIKAFYYIVIATSTKTDIQVDIDEIATDLNSKVDKSDLAEVQCVVETYSNGTSWYRVYSDGWCEQGGTSNSSAVSFLKNYIDTNYNTSVSWLNMVSGSGQSLCVLNKTVSSISVQVKWATDNIVTTFTNGTFNWQACGYIEV